MKTAGTVNETPLHNDCKINTVLQRDCNFYTPRHFVVSLLGFIDSYVMLNPLLALPVKCIKDFIVSFQSQ